jgi:hypothetical protein
MDLLLLLQAFGTYPLPGSEAAALDFNGDGLIGMYDFLHLLSQQPSIIKE